MDIMVIFVAVELLRGQVFVTKRSGFPARDEQPQQFRCHIGFHLIVIVMVSSGYLL